MIEIEELQEFILFLSEHYQIDLIDNSGRRNRYPAEDGERLENLLDLFHASRK